MVQDPGDLILGVMDSAKVPAKLNVLRSHAFTTRGIRVTMRIIGESHWVTLEHGQRVLHEVLACVPIAPSACVFHHAFRKVEECSYQQQRYAVQATLTPLTEEIALRGLGESAIEVKFPHPFNGTSLPFTRIWWDADTEQIRWWTTHTYPLPGETIAVLSGSRYLINT